MPRDHELEPRAEMEPTPDLTPTQASPMSETKQAADLARQESRPREEPFERGFGLPGGSELTKAYIPALERAIAEKKRRQQSGK